MSDQHITLRVTRRTFFGVSCMIVGALAWNAATALADGSTATQSVLGSDLIMPYDGYLMLDSAPITGTKTIRFDLYQDPTGGTALWTETQALNLYNGRFSAGLGSSTSLTSTILDAEKLYLAMTVVETDSQGNTVDIELAGRQAIEPAPFAAWSGNAADFNVDGALDVAGSAALHAGLGVSGGATLAGGSNLSGGATITGLENDGSVAALQVGRDDGQGGMIIMDDNEISSTAGDLHINENTPYGMYLGGDLTLDGKFLPKYSAWNNTTGDGGATIVNDNGVYKTLMIMGNNSNGGDRSIRMYDDVRVEDDLTVNGDATIDSALSTKGNVTLGDGTGDSTTVSGSLTVNGGFTNFYTNTYEVSINGDGSSTTQRGRANIGTTTNRICMLTDVIIEDHDSDDVSSCRIPLSSSGSIYHLDAYAKGGTATYTYCRAVCFGW